MLFFDGYVEFVVHAFAIVLLADLPCLRIKTTFICIEFLRFPFPYLDWHYVELLVQFDNVLFVDASEAYPTRHALLPSGLNS